MKSYLKWIILTSSLLNSTFVFSQNTVNKQISILPIPYTIVGEDIREVIQREPIIRVALTKVKEFLNRNGYTAIDFEARLKKAELDGNFRGIDNAQTIKSIFIDNANADIYLEIDINYNQSTTGNSVSLLINAYMAATSTVFASFECNSQKFYTEDISHLVKRALQNCEEDFKREMLQGSNDLISNGSSLQFQIIIDEESPFTLYSNFIDSELLQETAPLKYLIEFWLNESGYVHYYGDVSSGEKFMKIGEMRIKPEDEHGNSTSPSKVSFKLNTYLRKLSPTNASFPALRIEEDELNGTRYLRIK